MVGESLDSDDEDEWDEFRVEHFEIAYDEQLIGCELHYDGFLRGVTWLKAKDP